MDYKKLSNISITYFVSAMAFGVFYREFTKFNGFTGRTALAFGHVHLMVLGCLMFLLIILFAKNFPLLEQKLFRPFLVTYNIALPVMVIMLAVRGIVQVKGIVLSSGADAAISGIAGVTHIALFVGLLLLLLALRKAVEAQK